MKYFGLSDIGSFREKNQDSFDIVTNSNGDLLAMVADGIGGAKAGEIASRMTCDFIKNAFISCDKFESYDELIEYFKRLIVKVNDYILNESYKNNEYFGMGTTLTGVCMSSIGNICFNVGDSRTYGYNGTNLIQLTYDDTLVNEMIKLKEITPEEALVHPKRHYLLRAIGSNSQYEPAVNIIPNYDYYLICSDGLHGYLSEDVITDIINESNLSIKEKCEKMLSLTLKKGGYDNITIVLLKNE